MAKVKLTREAVESALAEYRQKGEEIFLKEYGFRPSRNYVLEHDGRSYHSKAVVAVAYKYLPGGQALTYQGLRGGKQDAAKHLEGLGFKLTGVEQDPDWSWDEHVLALDLYLAFKGQPPRKDDPAIVELSEFLRRRYAAKARTERFRNINGVYMKLMNFRRVDPAFSARGRVGLPGGNDTEEAVWARYSDDQYALAIAVAALRAPQSDDFFAPLSQEEEDEGAAEGSEQLREHKVRERDSKLIRKKKNAVMKSQGFLRCEVCDLRFEERYGGHGANFIEVHHINPVALSKPGRKTKLSELACVCSNCHRMLHFGGLRTIEWLKAQLRPPSAE